MLDNYLHNILPCPNGNSGRFTTNGESHLLHIIINVQSVRAPVEDPHC